MIRYNFQLSAAACIVTLADVMRVNSLPCYVITCFT